MGETDGAAWMALMRGGQWAEAWQISDAALAARAGRRDWYAPRHLQAVWDGTPLHDRRVLVRCYHGLGDTIQFIRFIPCLRDIAAEVTTWVQPALIPLLRTMPGVGRLEPLHDGTPEIAHDVDIEIMELAHALRVTPATLPAEVPYLHPPEPRTWQPGLAVGLVWAAGEFDPARSVPLRLLEPLADVPGVQLHVLQHGPALAERPPGFGLDAETADILALASHMRGLDLVISVDTMPAHLAGALGVPVWLMLRQDADWRWMQDRDTSPWYPTMRLFRQAESGDWAPLARRVVTCLRDRAESGGGHRD
ncbi:MAG: ADP-heptose--LPS heptosyltransferase [Pseudomonadota bacterium]